MKKILYIFGITLCTLLCSIQANAGELVEEIDLQEIIEVQQYSDTSVTAEEYIKQCMLEKQSMIDISSYDLTTTELSQIYANIINYTPELFYINNKYSVTINSTTRKVKTLQKFYYYANSDYSADTTTIAQKSAEIDSVIAKIKAGVDSKSSSFEKILYLHDYLVENIEYDYSSVLNQSSTSNYPKTDFDMYGALVLGKCVCQGYSHAFKYICEYLNIGECGFAATSNHIWNQIKIGSYYYNIDCTYDDYTYDIGMKASHANFLKSDTVFKSSHGTYTGDFTCNSTLYDSMSLNDIYTHLHYFDGKYYYVSQSYLKSLTIDSYGNITYNTDSIHLPDGWTYTNCYFYDKDYLFYNTKTSVYIFNRNNGKYYDYKLTGKNIFGVSFKDNIVYYYYRHSSISTNSTVESVGQLTFTADLLTQLEQSGNDSDSTETNKPVKFVKISSTKARIPVNGTLYLSAKYYPEDADNVKTVAWTSSNKSIATVNNKGKVTAKSTGTVRITYTVNGTISASCTLTVYNYGLTKIGTKLYYFDKKGNRVKNKWKTINGKKYYFGKKYYAVTGWQNIKKKKYYFNSNGIMQTKWKTIRGKKYYFGKNGKMCTGWVKIGKYKYYFNKSGVYKKRKKR